MAIRQEQQLSMPLIGIALILLLVIILILLNRRRNNALASRLPTTLLLGPPGTGKTRLFSYLRYNEILLDTRPSLECNSFVLRIANSGAVEYMQRVLDIPGHPRLRQEYLRAELPTARQIVFLMNYQPSQSRDFHDATDYLYSVLSRMTAAEQSNPVSVLVAINQVQPAFLGQIRKKIESEFDGIRKSLAATRKTLASSAQEGGGAHKDYSAAAVGEDDEVDEGIVGGDKIYLGFDDGKPFNFDHLDSNCTRVEFASGDDYPSIRNWIVAKSSDGSASSKKQD